MTKANRQNPADERTGRTNEMKGATARIAMRH